MSISKIETLSKEELEQLVSNSTSTEEILKKLDYQIYQQRTINILLAKCEELNIPYSHLLIPEGHRRCLQCNEIKLISDFYGNRKLCKECVKLNERNKYHSFKDQLNAYKQKASCAKCGCDKFYLLEFHHKDPSKKEFTISDSTRAKFETIKPELDKCIVLCANCHREFHYLNDKNNISLEEYLGGYPSW